jgi:TonB family protein
MSDAVIGKLGNTINKDFDTLVATDEEIKGQIVSTTTVTAAPRFRKRVMPNYTPEMIDNRIEGVVKVKALVDIDGKVKKAEALNDLGFEAARQALDASLAMEFDPAMRGKEPVAVWIIIPIRFVMIG